MSSYINCPVTAKALNGPLVLPPGVFCTNSQQNYTILPAQPTGTTYNWSLNPPSGGSIISGQGTSTVTIQWNNNPITINLMCTVKICNDSLSKGQMATLNAPIPANISQLGQLCPGDSVQLSAGPGPYNAASWSPGGAGTPIWAYNAGLYVVTTTDFNGCQSTDSYNVNALPAPVASISTASPLTHMCAYYLRHCDPNRAYQYELYLSMVLQWVTRNGSHHGRIYAHCRSRLYTRLIYL